MAPAYRGDGWARGAVRLTAMGKKTTDTLAARIEARQEALADHTRDLSSQLSPRALAARAREDAKLAAAETREEIETAVREAASKAKAEAKALVADPKTALSRREVRTALGALAALVGIIAIVRLLRR